MKYIFFVLWLAACQKTAPVPKAPVGFDNHGCGHVSGVGDVDHVPGIWLQFTDGTSEFLPTDTSVVKLGSWFCK